MMCLFEEVRFGTSPSRRSWHQSTDTHSVGNGDCCRFHMRSGICTQAPLPHPCVIVRGEACQCPATFPNRGLSRQVPPRMCSSRGRISCLRPPRRATSPVPDDNPESRPRLPAPNPKTSLYILGRSTDEVEPNIRPRVLSGARSRPAAPDPIRPSPNCRGNMSGALASLKVRSKRGADRGKPPGTHSDRPRCRLSPRASCSTRNTMTCWPSSRGRAMALSTAPKCASRTRSCMSMASSRVARVKLTGPDQNDHAFPLRNVRSPDLTPWPHLSGS